MCGIVGYFGPRDATEVIISGLKKLEYRGYDSAGIAIHDGTNLEVMRAEGKLANLESLLGTRKLVGHLGIGHTRWATHGRPSEVNAHPHRVGRVVVVHNGIIENHIKLRDELVADGAVFQSETDTEIFAHLISRNIDGGAVSLLAATHAALQKVRGSYAIAVLDVESPKEIVGARQQSPLVVGVGKDEHLVASDIPALLEYTRDVMFLGDGEYVRISSDGVHRYDRDLKEVALETRRVTWDPLMAQKGGYRHFMLKEIHEQPRAVSDTLTGRISRETGRVILDDTFPDHTILRTFKEILIVACGTSWHSGHIGKFMLEQSARIPTHVDYASEFRYRSPIVPDGTLCIAISQSGETADTLAAAQLAKEQGAKVLAVCNVIESSLARMSDFVLYTHAGPEMGVASTKAFATQIVALKLLSLAIAAERGVVPPDEIRRRLQTLARVPKLMEEVLADEKKYAAIAQRYKDARDFLYLGRGVHYPLALEGALKLKEISYIHAEGYPAGEMKHGPIALIDKNMPVVAVMTQSPTQEKMISNVQEVRARDGRVIGIVSSGDRIAEGLLDDKIEIPHLDENMDVLLAMIPLQLIAYYVATERGTDVDQPRNLAKSVTVE